MRKKDGLVVRTDVETKCRTKQNPCSMDSTACFAKDAVCRDRDDVQRVVGNRGGCHSEFE